MSSTSSWPGGTSGAASDAINIDDLKKSLRRPRSLLSFLLTALTTVLTLSALTPLFSVVCMLVVHGLGKLSLASLTTCTGELDGAFGNAIVGTIFIVLLAALISVPIGVIAAVYLAEIGPESKLASVVRFAAKTFSGFPSILAGVVTYAALFFLVGYSAISGAVALSILMLPTIILTSEEAIRMVPAKIREAAVGMGATSTQTILRVMLPTALPGILTGVMLAIARAAGETAPLLYTAKFDNYWPISSDGVTFTEPTASLAVFIFRYYKATTGDVREFAWAAALVLVAMVLVTNLIGQSLSRRTTR